eukprot:evm.model.scf_1231.1 EVM.evm.TU.scf_1231.1   scf_1231:20138-29551(-)
MDCDAGSSSPQRHEPFKACSGPPLAFDARGQAEPLLAEAFDRFRVVMCGADPDVVRSQLNELQAGVQGAGLHGERALAAVVQARDRCLFQNLDCNTFTLFYRFVFFVCRDMGKRALQVERAVQAWKIVLKNRFRLLDRWCEFVMGSARLVITEDTWRQVLDFSRQIHEDLRNYDPSSAWPVLLDEFVDYQHKQRASFRNRIVERVERMVPNCTLSLQPYSPRLMALSPASGSKRRRPDDVEAVAAQLSHLPMVSSNLEGEGQGDSKRICLQRCQSCCKNSPSAAQPPTCEASMESANWEEPECLAAQDGLAGYATPDPNPALRGVFGKASGCCADADACFDLSAYDEGCRHSFEVVEGCSESPQF